MFLLKEYFFKLPEQNFLLFQCGLDVQPIWVSSASKFGVDIGTTHGSSVILVFMNARRT